MSILKKITKNILAYCIAEQHRKRNKSLKYSDKKYDFINWLRFANAGMLSGGNILCFDYAIKHLPSENPIVEIGSFCGLSTNVISFYTQIHGRKNRIITSDKWIFEGAERQMNVLEGSDIPHIEYRKFVKDTYIRNIKFFSKNNMPFTIEEFSDDFFKLWKKNIIVNDVIGREIKLGGNISFAYIDGNHTYEYAKRDFINVDKYLDIDGFILFDDSSDGGGFGVSRLMNEIKNNKNYKKIINNPNYLFQKINC